MPGDSGNKPKSEQPQAQLNSADPASAEPILAESGAAANSDTLTPEVRQEIRAIMKERGQTVAEIISREDIARTAAEAADAKMKTMASKISKISLTTGAAGTLAGIFSGNIEAATAGVVGGKQIATAAYTVAAATKAIVTAYYSAKATTAIRRTGDLAGARKALGLSSQEEASADTAANEAPESEVTTRARLIIDRASQTNASLDKIEGSKYGLGANESIKKLGNEGQRSAINTELQNFYASYKSAENDEARAAATKAFNSRIDELNKSGAFGSKGQRTSAVSSFLIGDHGDSIVSTRSIKKAAEDLVKDLAEKDIKSDDFAEYLNSDDGKNSFNIYEASLKRDVETRQAVDNVAAAVALGGVIGGVTFAALARDARIKSRSFLGASVSGMVANTVTSGVFGGARGFSKARRLISEAELRDIHQDQPSNQPSESQPTKSNAGKNILARARENNLKDINNNRGRKNIQDIYNELDQNTMLAQLYQSDNKLETFKELQKNNPDALKKMLNGLATDDKLSTLAQAFNLGPGKEGSPADKRAYYAEREKQKGTMLGAELKELLGSSDKNDRILECLLNVNNSEIVKARLLDTLADLEARDQISSRRKIDLIRWGKYGASKGRLGLTERIIKAQDLLGDYDRNTYDASVRAKSTEMEAAQSAVDRERKRMILTEVALGAFQGIVVGSVSTLAITNAKKILTAGKNLFMVDAKVEYAPTAGTKGQQENLFAQKGQNLGYKETVSNISAGGSNGEVEIVKSGNASVIPISDGNGKFNIIIDVDGNQEVNEGDYQLDGSFDLSKDEGENGFNKLQEILSGRGIEIDRNEITTKFYKEMSIAKYLENYTDGEGGRSVELKIGSGEKTLADFGVPTVAVGDGMDQYEVSVWGKNGGSITGDTKLYIDLDGDGDLDLEYDIQGGKAILPASVLDTSTVGTGGTAKFIGNVVVGHKGDDGKVTAFASIFGRKAEKLSAMVEEKHYAFTTYNKDDGTKTSTFAIDIKNKSVTSNLSEIFNGKSIDGKRMLPRTVTENTSIETLRLSSGAEIPNYESNGGYDAKNDSLLNKDFVLKTSYLGTPIDYDSIDDEHIPIVSKQDDFLSQFFERTCTNPYTLGQNAVNFGLLDQGFEATLGLSGEDISELERLGVNFDGGIDTEKELNVFLGWLKEHRTQWDSLANATTAEMREALAGAQIEVRDISNRNSTYANSNGMLDTSRASLRQPIVYFYKLDENGNKVYIGQKGFLREKLGGRIGFMPRCNQTGAEVVSTPKPKVAPTPKVQTPTPQDTPKPIESETPENPKTPEEPENPETPENPKTPETENTPDEGDSGGGGGDKEPDTPKDPANMTRIEEQNSEDTAKDIHTGEVRVHQTTEIEETPTAAPTAEEYVGTAPDIVQNDASTKAESITVSKPDLGGVTMPTDISPENDYTRDLGGTHDNVDVGRVPNVTDQEDLEAIRIANENEIKYEDAPTTGKDAWESIFNTEGNDLTNNNANTGGNDMADGNIDTEINDAANSKAA